MHKNIDTLQKKKNQIFDVVCINYLTWFRRLFCPMKDKTNEEIITLNIFFFLFLFWKFPKNHKDLRDIIRIKFILIIRIKTVKVTQLTHRVILETYDVLNAIKYLLF